jgi:hypothetical protein
VAFPARRPADGRKRLVAATHFYPASLAEVNPEDLDDRERAGLSTPGPL